MSIFDRIQRIARANLNFLLSRAENPELMLEEKVRELEGAITEGKEAAAMYGATYRKMEREQERLRQEQSQWQQRAQDALAAGDENLARKCLGEKIKLHDRLRTLEPGVTQGRATFEQLRAGLKTLSEQVIAAQLKQQELKTRKAAAQAQQAFGHQVDKATAAARPGGEFERFEDKVMHQEAVVEIETQIREDTLGDDVDLEKRSRELQVDAELRALKASLNAEDAE